MDSIDVSGAVTVAMRQLAPEPNQASIEFFSGGS